MAGRTLSQYAQTTDLGQSKPVSYLKIYEEYFAHLMDEEVRVLELGVANGASLIMWNDYFVNGTIVGVDLFPRYQLKESEKRIRVYKGAQDDSKLLADIAQEIAPNGFDIIIDDCSHIGELSKNSFWYLFTNHLKPGGIYVIEDWGTGYFGGYRNVYYPDGEFFDPTERETFMHWLANKILKTAPVEWQETGWWQKLLKRYQYTRRFKVHNYGLVGFVTQLIGEVGIGDITSPGGVAKPKDPSEPQKQSRFAHVLYAPGVVLVTKKN
jgi:hypothetical protein